MRVLLTRPEVQSNAFAASLAPRFEVIVSPIIEVRFKDIEVDFTVFDALVFTSQNGVLAYQSLNGPRDMTAYCVGLKTAELAKQIGLNATSADGDVSALNALLDRQAKGQSMLHLSGVHTAGQLVGSVKRVISYDQVEIALNERAADTLATQGDVFVPLFSPRSAKLFQSQVGAKTKANLHAICLSTAVFEQLDDTLFASVQTCERPTAASMRDKMSGIFPP